MFDTYIKGLQDGLDDDSRTAYRTMFVLKRDVATAIALAQFHDSIKEIFNTYSPSEHSAMVCKQLADFDAKLNDTT